MGAASRENQRLAVVCEIDGVLERGRRLVMHNIGDFGPERIGKEDVHRRS